MLRAWLIEQNEPTKILVVVGLSFALAVVLLLLIYALRRALLSDAGPEQTGGDWTSGYKTSWLTTVPGDVCGMLDHGGIWLWVRILPCPDGQKTPPTSEQPLPKTHQLRIGLTYWVRMWGVWRRVMVLDRQGGDSAEPDVH